jgi:hypothetical protein
MMGWASWHRDGRRVLNAPEDSQVLGIDRDWNDAKYSGSTAGLDSCKLTTRVNEESNSPTAATEPWAVSSAANCALRENKLLIIRHLQIDAFSVAVLVVCLSRGDEPDENLVL